MVVGKSVVDRDNPFVDELGSSLVVGIVDSVVGLQGIIAGYVDLGRFVIVAVGTFALVAAGKQVVVASGKLLVVVVVVVVVVVGGGGVICWLLCRGVW